VRGIGQGYRSCARPWVGRRSCGSVQRGCGRPDPHPTAPIPDRPRFDLHPAVHRYVPPAKTGIDRTVTRPTPSPARDDGRDGPAAFPGRRPVPRQRPILQPETAVDRFVPHAIFGVASMSCVLAGHPVSEGAPPRRTARMAPRLRCNSWRLQRIAFPVFAGGGAANPVHGVGERLSDRSTKSTRSPAARGASAHLTCHVG
jgi:hypothetical protein